MKNSEMKELIYGHGEFNESGFKDVIESVGEAAAVVAIIGPQGSGKSTLMNQLFGTNFKEMDAKAQRSQTTQGIWIAKAPHIEPSMVVLDLEGTDGKERGADDTTFEKQSALFALAVADTVIVNMDFKSIGLDYGASRPLLKIIFEVMLSLFSPQKTTLMFVLRDHDKMTTSENLEDQLKKDVVKIWAGVPKPPGHEYTPLSEIFDVKVTVLSHYVLMRHDFDQEVAQLKLKLISHPKRDNTISKNSLSNAKIIWDMIKENKDLNIPPIRVMFATIRCQMIVMDKLKLFEENQDWLDLKRNTETHFVEGFSAKTRSILKTYLSEYDKESVHLDENVRKDKRKYLKSEVLKVIHTGFMNTLNRLCAKAMQSFTTELKESGLAFSAPQVKTSRESCVLYFDRQYTDHVEIKQANWEDYGLAVRQQLLHITKEHALSLLREQLSTDLTTSTLNQKDHNNINDKWASIRKFLKREVSKAKSAVIDIFGKDQEQVERMVADLEKHARNKVETNFKKESRNAAELMKKSFKSRFTLKPKKSKPTVYKEEAYSQCLDILSTMAVIRIDDTYDVVQRELYSELMGANSGNAESLSSMTSWEKVPQQMTLITPVKCKDIWDDFKIYTEPFLAEQESNIQKKRDEQELLKCGVAALSLVVSLAGASVGVPTVPG